MSRGSRAMVPVARPVATKIHECDAFDLATWRIALQHEYRRTNNRGVLLAVCAQIGLPDKATHDDALTALRAELEARQVAL